MVTTTLYLHAANSTVSGTLPTTEQSSRTASYSFDAGTVNRSMDTVKGSAQTSISKAITCSVSNAPTFVAKFVSPPLNLTTISANTWTTFGAVAQSNSNAYWWTGTSDGYVPQTMYVWRPSGGGSKVGNVFDAASTFQTNTNGPPANQEYTSELQFTGSAVTCQVGDVLIYEVWGRIDSNNQNYTYYYYLDGTVVPTQDQVSASNCASYISTPQTLAFQTPPVDCTVTKKTITNKFIIKH